VPTLFSEAGENFKAYNVNAHRHWPEIKQIMEGVSGNELNFVFTPHLVPMVRGIYATLYATESSATDDLLSLYQKRYKQEPFVQVLDEGVLPETKHARASNQCILSVSKPYGGNTTVVLSVIDNLVKGAAGQAVQNMNLMFAVNETTGLMQAGVFP